MSDQLVSKPVGVHLILADPWSKEWGQPHFYLVQSKQIVDEPVTNEPPSFDFCFGIESKVLGVCLTSTALLPGQTCDNELVAGNIAWVKWSAMRLDSDIAQFWIHQAPAILSNVPVYPLSHDLR